MTPANNPLIARKLSEAACKHIGIDLEKNLVHEVRLSLPRDDLVMLHFDVYVSADDLAKIVDIARGLP